jgi:hypothetical protein
MCMGISPVVSYISVVVCEDSRVRGANWAMALARAGSRGCGPFRRRPLPWPRRSSAACPRNMLVNQNLLYLVFKCLMNTKHSGSGRAPQAVFDAQEEGRKTIRKTGLCGGSAGICNNNPPLIHTFVHGLRAADERSVDVAELLHHEFMLRRNLGISTAFMPLRASPERPGLPFIELHRPRAHSATIATHAHRTWSLCFPRRGQ